MAELNDIRIRLRGRRLILTVPGDILPNLPEDSVLGRLGRAGAEELRALQPDTGNAVILLALARGTEFEDGVGPVAVFWRRVRGGDGGFSDGVGEAVIEEEEGAGGREEIGG